MTPKVDEFGLMQLELPGIPHGVKLGDVVYRHGSYVGSVIYIHTICDDGNKYVYSVDVFSAMHHKQTKLLLREDEWSGECWEIA
jgi:hypothetical protein